MTGLRKKIVFVLGMHRSGTSLTAELVHAMGFSVPGTMLEAVGEINAHGFWESEEVVSLNERMLEAVGARWFHVLQFGRIFSMPGILSGFSGEIASFLANQAAVCGDLVIKDPRLCLLWPVWLSAIDEKHFEVKVIYVNRHPSSVASSVSGRDGFSTTAAELLWLNYFFAVFGRKGLPEILFLNYENLLIEKSVPVFMADYIGVSAVDDEVLDGVIDPSLQRNPVSGIASAGFVGSLAEKIFRACPMCSLLPKDSLVFPDDFRVVDEYVANCSELVLALNHTNDYLVESRSTMIGLGDMHSHALQTIKEKDEEIARAGDYIQGCHARIVELERAVKDFDVVTGRLAELDDLLVSRNRDLEKNALYIRECEARIEALRHVESDCEQLRVGMAVLQDELVARDADIVRNSEYISRCELRIKELHDAMEQFEALRARLAEVEDSLRQRDIDVQHNADYIEQCELRIRELHNSMEQFDELRLRLAEVESVLVQREADVTRNADYISRCESRIAELDHALVDFEALRNRLAEVEAALAQRDADVLHNTSYIEKCHSRIAELDNAVIEFELLRARLAKTDSELDQKNIDILALNACIDSCRTNIVDLERELSAERTELVEAYAHISSLNNDVAVVIAERDAVNEQLLLVNARLQHLLASRVVRLVERLTIKTVH